MSLGCKEADAILATYRNAFDGFDLTEPLSSQCKYHFIVRLWRVTGSEEWRAHPAVVRHLDETGKRLRDATRAAGLGGNDVAGWDVASAAFRATVSFIPQAWLQTGQSSIRMNHSSDLGTRPRSIKGKTVKQPERESSGAISPEKVHLWYLMSLMMALQKLVDHGLDRHPLYAHSCEAAQDILRSSMNYFSPQNHNWEQMLLEDPVKAVNCICRLRRLDIVPMRWLDATWVMYQKVWTIERRKQYLELYVYGLTHFILDCTDFYQKRLDLKLFSSAYDLISKFMSGSIFREILHYFETESDLILKLADPDVLAEVGLCFRVCGREDSAMCQQCTDFVRSHVRFCKLEHRVLLFAPGRLSSRGMLREEHMNCIGLLLLATWQKTFFKGPQYTPLEWDILLSELSTALADPEYAGKSTLELPAVHEPGSKLLRLTKDPQISRSLGRSSSQVESYAERRKRLQLLGILSG